VKPKLHILKVGGLLVNDAAALQEALAAFAGLAEAKLLVHGGGRHATALAKQLGISPKMVNGRRITDTSMLEVAVMSYAGLSNKKIVAQLQKQGVNAVGLTGADGNCIQAIKRPVTDIDYGFAGDITQVNKEVFAALTSKDFVPVLCAITHDNNGQLLNTNAGQSKLPRLALGKLRALCASLKSCKRLSCGRCVLCTSTKRSAGL